MENYLNLKIQLIEIILIFLEMNNQVNKFY